MLRRCASAQQRSGELMQSWTYISELRKGEVFKTRDGVYAVKSEYHLEDGRCMCILLASGEYAYFADGDRTVVQVVHIEGCSESLGDPPTVEELRAFIQAEVRKVLSGDLRTSSGMHRSVK